VRLHWLHIAHYIALTRESLKDRLGLLVGLAGWAGTGGWGLGLGARGRAGSHCHYCVLLPLHYQLAQPGPTTSRCNWSDLRPPNLTPSTGSPPSRWLYQPPAAMGGRAEHP
jgi:hypothetical protein